MGFLDRMISNLIQDNTGINARRMVRKIGGGKLLALGGAALAAGIFAEKKGMFGQGAGQQAAPPLPAGAPAAPPPPLPEGTQPGAAAAAPPPPPIPGAAPPPPPPIPGAAPAAADDADELPQEVTYAIVRTMVAAALADGHMGREEKAMIHKHLGESGLSEEQTRQIHQDLVLPPSPADLAALAPAAEAREILYRFGALVVLADQEVSDLERRWLERLATAFELGDEQKAALEAEIFAPENDG